jgi:ribosomal protein S18 acetylase RimI-like enzyme
MDLDLLKDYLSLVFKTKVRKQRLMSRNFVIKYASKGDLRKISKCHKLAFPNSLSSAMGLSYLTKMFEWYLSAPNKFIFWIEEEGECLGYCGGYLMDGSDSTGAASGMLQISFNQAILSIVQRPWLFFHPELLNKYKFIFGNFLRKVGLVQSAPFKNVNPDKYEEKLLSSGLIVIGVNPKFQGRGVGFALMNEFERKSILMGSKQLELSVLVGNEKAITAYSRSGYFIVSKDSTSFRMKKPL